MSICNGEGILKFKIWVSHSGVADSSGLLWCDAVSIVQVDPVILKDQSALLGLPDPEGEGTIIIQTVRN